MNSSTIKPIGYIQNSLPEKFGVPRQSGVIPEFIGTIVLTPEYRNPDALRGLSDFSHIWLIWQFSEVKENAEFSPTVRPPRLGGNERMGVFATRSPFRPNRLGLTVAKIEEINEDDCTITVSGIDMMNGTPIFDIKPYIPYADCIPEATSGFTNNLPSKTLSVAFDESVKTSGLTENDILELTAILSHDPRPAYQDDPERIYGMSFKNKNVSFKIKDELLTVVEIK